MYKYLNFFKYKEVYFVSPFKVLLGYIICKDGLIVYLAKTAVITDLVSPTTIKQVCTMLPHIGYYHKFMHGYAQITTSLEKMLKKYNPFVWTEECHKAFHDLKEKLVMCQI